MSHQPMNDRQRTLEGRWMAAGRRYAPRSIADLEPRVPYLDRLIRCHFPRSRDAIILDLGCGHGALVHRAHQAGYHHTRGVDSSPEQVEVARRLGIARVELGEAFETLASCTAGSIDCVITFDLLEHCTHDDSLRLMEEVARVLLPGGRWILHTVNGASPFFGAVRYGDPTHRQAFTRELFQRLLPEVGFDDGEFHEDEPVVHGPTSAFRFLLWKLIRSVLVVVLAAETGLLDPGRVLTQNLLVIARRTGTPAGSVAGSTGPAGPGGL